VRVSDEHIVYEASTQDLPEFLPWFTVPVPRAFFAGIFRPQSKKGPPYVGDAFAFNAGDTFYDSREGYTAVWQEALQHINWCVIVTSPKVAASREPNAPLGFRLLRPSKARTHLAETLTGTIARAHFLRFLQVGELAVLVPDEEGPRTKTTRMDVLQGPHPTVFE